ncbi:MAG: DUF1592 domain-containing protein [Gammaproteobacteria bacterium]|nr:DUF1592 domain-containing protein [Gammaproteobacteria bacterium]
MEPLEYSARQIANNVLNEEHRAFFVPCAPAAVNVRDDVCAREYLSKVGGLLYRRPLTPAELKLLVEIAGRSVGTAGDFYFGLASSVSGMLVSPQFLYIQENLEHDPDRADSWRLDGYSKASRLSFFLWNSAPDNMLLHAAESGDLHSPAGLGQQVERMITSHRVESSLRAFFDDMLILESFDTMAKDPVIYPAFTLKVVSDAREQSLRIIVDHLLSRDGDYRDLFVTRRTFLSRGLGMIYQLPVQGDSDGWTAYEFPEASPRAGLLMQAGFLSQYSHPGRSSPTKRGRGLRETILCQVVPDPPGNVDIATFEDASAKTARDRLSVHSTDPTCAGCHRLTDRIGIALENFDGAGQFRLTENGERIDPHSELDGIEFADANGLGQAVRDNPALTSCLVDRLYSYAVGRRIERNEVKWVAYLEDRFAKGGYRIRDLLRIIANSEAFYRTTRGDSDPQLLATTNL